MLHGAEDARAAAHATLSWLSLVLLMAHLVLVKNQLQLHLQLLESLQIFI